MTVSLPTPARLLAAGGFALAVAAAPLVAVLAGPAPAPANPQASCPANEVLDPTSGACRPVTDVAPSTLNPIEPGKQSLQPDEVTSARPGDVGSLPEVDGIPCTGASGSAGGGTGECIGLVESNMGKAHVGPVVPEVTP